MILKRNRLGIAVALAAVLALASCSQDELADGDNMLPDGQYPLEIASATLAVEGSEQPWTKVGENVDGTGSEFTANDAITVSLGSETAAYTYDGSAWTSTAPLYWQSTQQATVNAWYPTAENVSLADQSEGLAYVLKGSGTGSYQSGVNLTFTHQLAKVRVVLSGSQADQVTEVGIKSYTSCTHNQGTVSTDGASEDWITMQKVTYNGTECWEANVVPGHTITQFKVNDTEGTLDGSGVTPVAASLHTITLTVKSSIPDDAKEITGSINDNGNYVVSGTRSEAINITGGSPHIYLDDVQISVSSGPAINITGGTPTIHVVGTGNSVTSSNGAGIYVVSGSTVTITGSSRDDVLTVKGGDGSSGIGGYKTGDDTAANCGNIVITKVQVAAYGSFDDGGNIAPGIGGAGSASCGTITIDAAKVYAYGVNYSTNMSSSAIGGGINMMEFKGSFGIITIRNGAEVNVQRGNAYSDYIGYSGSMNIPATGDIIATVDETSKVTKLN